VQQAPERVNREITRRVWCRGSAGETYCTDLPTTTLSPHSDQMKASMDEDPGNVFSASQ